MPGNRQALAAKSGGSPFLTPRVRGKPMLLAEAAGLLERWSTWLGMWGDEQASGTALFEALGLPAPPANIALLLTWMAEQLRAQTAGEAAPLDVGAR